MQITAPVVNGRQILHVTFPDRTNNMVFQFDSISNLDGAATLLEGFVRDGVRNGVFAQLIKLAADGGEQSAEIYGADQVSKWSLQPSNWLESERGETLFQRLLRILKTLLVV